MRVLFFSEIHDPGVGSSVRQTFRVAAALRARGHQAAVLSTVRDPQDAFPTEVEGTPVFRIHSDYNVRWRGWVSLKNPAITRPLDAVLAEWRPDVVHAHLVHTHIGYDALTQARAAGAGVVFTAHDVMVFCYQKLTCFHGGEKHKGMLEDYTARPSKCIPCQRFRFRPGRNQRIREVLERDVHRFTVVSDALGEIIRANGIRVDRTLHNAIEPKEPPASEAVDAFRERFGLTGKRVIAIGGRLHEQKGVGKLLEMLARLAPEFPDVRLLVMGKRAIYDGEFAAQARALGVAEHVVPTDYLSGDDLACAYAATDVFATPSICFDTFGLVNLEAMEHRKPVVATSFGGSKEVIEDGVSGFIANPFDLDSFTERLACLLRDPALRLEMGERGYELMQQRFTIDRLTSECLEEYGAARDSAGSIEMKAT
ncbi:MAG: glycosyltransferase family 4 protein [bacterium]|nr:glycosyltransferase family 4 protein [bacterium]